MPVYACMCMCDSMLQTLISKMYLMIVQSTSETVGAGMMALNITGISPATPDYTHTHFFFSYVLYCTPCRPTGSVSAVTPGVERCMLLLLAVYKYMILVI